MKVENVQEVNCALITDYQQIKSLIVSDPTTTTTTTSSSANRTSRAGERARP